ncbi:MAG: hypothetical protein HQL46_13085 [Gammaproteobacteria bacterium]|nr:hypothetical protein [Gammaproteobacteria bacterium]
MKREFLKSFYIAGFTYYEGAYVFPELKIGDKLKLNCDKKNKHDDFAVEINYKNNKLGFIPQNENREIFKLLVMGYDIFECVVQQLAPENHPAEQVRVGIFIIDKNKK